MPGHDEALALLRDNLRAGALLHEQCYGEPSAFFAPQLTAIDATLAELERGRAVIARLQEMARSRYQRAWYERELYQAAARERVLDLQALDFYTDAQTDAAALSRLVRVGLGIEPADD